MRLFVLSAVLLSTAHLCLGLSIDQSMESAPCVPEMEGMLVGAESGAIIGVRFRGHILVQMDDGKATSPAVGWFADSKHSCPWLRAREVRLESDGGLDEEYSL